MRDESRERYPSCVPFRYRAFLQLRKLRRQAAVRAAERAARLNGNGRSGIVPDGKAFFTPRPDGPLPNPRSFVNKSDLWMEEDLAAPEAAAVVQGIERLKQGLSAKGLKFTNTAATFLPRLFLPRPERSKLWENAWTIAHAGVEAGQRALDIGGASTPFSFYLASLGLRVDVVDNDWGNCGTIYNANHVVRRMGWELKAHDRDVAQPLPFPDGCFDRVFSICTIEHLGSATRRIMMREAGRVLKPGGLAAITLCYDPNHEVLLVDKGLRFGYREKLEADVIAPSGLRLHGNTELVDYAGEKGFLGALFLEKPI